MTRLGRAYISVYVCCLKCGMKSRDWTKKKYPFIHRIYAIRYISGIFVCKYVHYTYYIERTPIVFWPDWAIHFQIWYVPKVYANCYYWTSTPMSFITWPQSKATFIKVWKVMNWCDVYRYWKKNITENYTDLAHFQRTGNKAND